MKRLLLAFGLLLALAAPALADSAWFIQYSSGAIYAGPYPDWATCNKMLNLYASQPGAPTSLSCAIKYY